MNRLFVTLLIAGLFMACAAKKNAVGSADELSGTWQLDYISGPRIAFEGLYPNKKPFLKIEVDSNRVSGNSSCNNFFGKLNREGRNISFKEGLGMTKMACQGEGESVFIRTLEKIDKYDLTDDGNMLHLIMGDIAMMRFKRQE